MAEPGRGMVAEAGHIGSRSASWVSRQIGRGARRWVYLDIGRFSGLPKPKGEATRYCSS